MKGTLEERISKEHLLDIVEENCSRCAGEESQVSKQLYVGFDDKQDSGDWQSRMSYKKDNRIMLPWHWKEETGLNADYMRTREGLHSLRSFLYFIISRLETHKNNEMVWASKMVLISTAVSQVN